MNAPDTEPEPEVQAPTQETDKPGRWESLSGSRTIGESPEATETVDTAATTADAGENASELVIIQHADGRRFTVSRLAFRDLYQPFGFSEAGA